MTPEQAREALWSAINDCIRNPTSLGPELDALQSALSALIAAEVEQATAQMREALVRSEIDANALRWKLGVVNATVRALRGEREDAEQEGSREGRRA